MKVLFTGRIGNKEGFLTTLGAYYDYKGVGKDVKPLEFLSEFKKSKDYDKKVKTVIEKENEYLKRVGFGDKNLVRDVEAVVEHTTKWVLGEYYAHEYDAYISGRSRKQILSNGFIQYEIEGLDKTKHLADGYSTEPNGNGSGDYFRPDELPPDEVLLKEIIKKYDLKNVNFFEGLIKNPFKEKGYLLHKGYSLDNKIYFAKNINEVKTLIANKVKEESVEEESYEKD